MVTKFTLVKYRSLVGQLKYLVGHCLMTSCYFYTKPMLKVMVECHMTMVSFAYFTELNNLCNKFTIPLQSLSLK